MKPLDGSPDATPSTVSVVRDVLRVLVVDDERICREMTARQLRVAGYYAEPAGDGVEAIARLEAGSWDVVLTDVHMPNMDGLALMREIKRRTPGVEVVLMTAHDTVRARAAEWTREGAAACLSKPFRFAELEALLRRFTRAGGECEPEALDA